MNAETPNQNNKNPEASSQQLPPDVEETLVPPEPTPAAEVTPGAEAESVAEAVVEAVPEPAPEAPEPIQETPEAPLPEAPGEEAPAEEQQPVEVVPGAPAEAPVQAEEPAEAPAAEAGAPVPEPAPEAPAEEPAPEGEPAPAAEPPAPEQAEAPAEVPEARLLPRNIKEEQKAKEQAIEQAMGILKDSKVMEIAPEKRADAYKEATGEDLEKITRKEVDKRLEERGMRVIRGKDAVEVYRKQLIEKEKQRIATEEQSKALTALWVRNPNIKPEDQKKELDRIKKGLGLQGADGEKALYRLINQGYVVEKPKKHWLGWFSNKIDLSKPGGKVVKTFASKEDILRDTLAETEPEILSQAERRADLKISEGRKILVAERQVCTRVIIEKAVKRYEEDKKEGKKMDYVGLKKSQDKIHSLNGHTSEIVPQVLSDMIVRDRLIRESGEKLSNKQWNDMMKLKKIANGLLEEWIDEQPKSKPEKKTKAKNKGEKPVTKPGGKKPSESESKPSKREKPEKKETPKNKKETPKKPAPKKKKK